MRRKMIPDELVAFLTSIRPSLTLALQIVTILLNGEPYEAPGPLSISQLLARLELDPRRVAVEHNMTVVKRARYEDTIIHERDQIEVVNFVGGGSLRSSGESAR